MKHSLRGFNAPFKTWIYTSLLPLTDIGSRGAPQNALPRSQCAIAAGATKHRARCSGRRTDFVLVLRALAVLRYRVKEKTSESGKDTDFTRYAKRNVEYTV